MVSIDLNNDDTKKELEELIFDSARTGLNEPVAVFMGVSPNTNTIAAEENYADDLDNPTLNSLVENFQSHGIKACRFDSPEAEDSSFLVVSNTGLQSAFIPPEEFEKTALTMKHIVDEVSGAHVIGKAHPVQEWQMMGAVDDRSGYSVPEMGITHPDSKKCDEIKAKYGPDFIEDMLKEAQNLPDTVYHEGDILTGSQHAQHYQIGPFYESRSVIYGTLEPSVAETYPLCAADYAFIKSYEPLGKIEGTKAFGIEFCGKPAQGEDIYEVPLYPGSSRPREEIFLRISDEQGNPHSKVIPQNAPKWQDFMELHRSGYDSGNKHLQVRRHNLKQEAQNGNLKTNSLLAQMNKSEIEKIADYRGVSADRMIVRQQQQKQKAKNVVRETKNEKGTNIAVGKGTLSENKTESKNAGKQISTIRGLGQQEAKPVTKTELNPLLTNSKQKGGKE